MRAVSRSVPASNVSVMLPKLCSHVEVEYVPYLGDVILEINP